MPVSENPNARGTARGPGRPRQFDVDALLDSVLELFWKRGYENTTTRDLELKLGISQSSLYNQFGSKQKLLNSALDRYELQTGKAVLEQLENSSFGLAAIDQFLTGLASWVTRDGRKGCLLINMMAEDGAQNAALTQRTRRYRGRVKQAFESQLTHAAALGELPDNNIPDKANLLMGLVLGFNIAARGGASSSELDALLKATKQQLNAWRLR